MHLLDLDVSHELLVEELGMVPRSVGEAENGIETDATQTAGGPHAIAFDDVVGDLEYFLGG